MHENTYFLNDILKVNNIRITPLRISCLNRILKFKHQFTVEQLLAEMRWQVKINKSIARRILNLYSRHGLLARTEENHQDEIRINYRWIGEYKGIPRTSTVA